MSLLEAALLELLKVQRGHFRYESSYHGEIWLDLDQLLLEPNRLEPFVGELAGRLARSAVDAVVGPLAGGAFIAHRIAAELATVFAYSEPQPPSSNEALYPVAYRLPMTVAPLLKGKRIAIVDDVINAGSAVRGAFNTLIEVGAKPVVVGALLVLGDTIDPFIKEHDLTLERIAGFENPLWPPASCPLCTAGIPLGGFESNPS